MDGLLLCDDLIFASRIVGTAKAAGLAVRVSKTTGDLLVFARQMPPRCVIIDLHVPGLDIAAVTAELTAQSPRPMIVAYGSHVDTATLKKARDAGCDVVWPRSKFMDELETALPTWIRSTETTT
jgi:DNA-binding NarL/FixJ family response regulator